jgi:uncharacterized protein
MGRPIDLTLLDCLRCGYVWRPRARAVSRCPRCKSLKWDSPKVRRNRRRGAQEIPSSLRSFQGEIVRLGRRHHAARLRLFGSFVRGDAGPSSDVDIIFDPGPRAQPFDRFHLQDALSALLGRQVDLVTEAGLHPMVRAQVLAEAVPL